MFFFAISAVPAQPSAGIGVVEVEKLEVFCDFCCSNWSSGVVSWFARLLPEPAGRGFDSSLVRGRASQDATCILKQLAQSNLRSQLAPTSLRRAPCLEQLAQSNLRRATYAEQLAQSNLHRAPCLVLSRACFTNASCREKERILQRWADLACDVLLSGQPWSSFFLRKPPTKLPLNHPPPPHQKKTGNRPPEPDGPGDDTSLEEEQRHVAEEPQGELGLAKPAVDIYIYIKIIINKKKLGQSSYMAEA